MPYNDIRAQKQNELSKHRDTFTQLKKQYLYGDNVTKELRSRVSNEIQSMHRLRNELLELDKLLSKHKGLLLEGEYKEDMAYITNQHEQMRTDYEAIRDCVDSIHQSHLIKEYVSKHGKARFMLYDKKQNMKKAEVASSLLNDCVVSVTGGDTTKVKPVKSKSVIDSKLKDTIKEALTNKKVSKKSIIETDDDIKKTVRSFLFKTLDECESSKRTTSYYMSKDELVKIIDADQKLKDKVGKSYKKMKKKELCEKLMHTI
jgi:hypothetical protein